MAGAIEGEVLDVVATVYLKDRSVVIYSGVGAPRLSKDGRWWLLPGATENGTLDSDTVDRIDYRRGSAASKPLRHAKQLDGSH